MEENEFKSQVIMLHEFFALNNITGKKALELMMYSISLLCLLHEFKSENLFQGFQDLIDHLKNYHKKD